MDLVTTVFGKTIRQMVLGLGSILKEIFTKVSGLMARHTAMAQVKKQMVEPTLVNGFKTSKTAKV